MKLLNKTLSLIPIFLLLFYQTTIPLTTMAQESTPAVILGQTYQAPQNEKVTITFTKLPENPGTITIKEITLTDGQVSETKALSNTAYDITSDMQNGTFEYTLILPTPKTENVEVKSSEDGQTFVTLGGVTAQTDTLTITGLNHFTVFVVAGTITSGVATPFNESTASVVINEFVYHPSVGQNEWVELFNKTNANISLTNWRLEDGNSLTTDDLTLSGTIPAQGIVVFEHASGWLNNLNSNGDGDTIILKDNTGSQVSKVTYQKSSSTIVDTQSVSAADPPPGQSIARTTDGGTNWLADITPSKGWANSLAAPTAVYINVNYSGTETGAQNQPFTTIQNGINAVAAGGTVNILAGSYDEAVTVSKNITIKGAGNTTIWKETGGDVALTISTGNVTVEKINFSNADTAIGVDGGNVTIKNSQISGNVMGVNTGEGVSLVTASQNFWGASTGPTHSTNSGGSGDSVSDNVSYRPFYTDSAQTTLSSSTLASSDFSPAAFFSSGIFSLPAGTTNQASTPSVNVNQQLTMTVALPGGISKVIVPSGTVISRVGGGNIDSSLLAAANVSVSSLSGFTSGTTVDGALQWGIPNLGLEFSEAITLNIFVGTALNGQTLNVQRSTSTNSGWISDGIVAPATCVVTAGVCTFQATKASYYATSRTVASSSSGSGSSTQALSAASGSVPAPTCSDQKPGSAPTLLSTTPTTNSVTLNWSQAQDPVTYYLATYGLSSGTAQYGNPNVGGKDTTSFTVQGLSGGTTYYFKVRAGNGCAPGDFSNELSATPGGGFIAEPAAGFAPGVLGVTSEQGNEATPGATQPFITPQAQTGQSPFNTKVVLVIVVAFLLGLGVFKLVIK